MNRHFEHIFFINLERRKDRLLEITNELKKHNITAELVTGIDGSTLDIKEMISEDGQIVSKGDIGCTLSHLKVVKLAKERGYKNYFVFEDDAELIINFNEVLDTYMKYVPNDWDFLYFGGNHMGGLQSVNLCVSKIFKTFTTHAFGVKETVYDAMIEVLGRENDKVDIGIASLHSKFNSYVFRPHIAFQRASYSDILNKYTDYQHLRE